MARLARISPVGIPLHVIQRGNNRQSCFAAPEDYAAYLNWLKEYSKKFFVSIHAWVLMTNHVHLLCTPEKDGAVSQMMQSVGRRYVQYFNRQYRRSGTLWEGRYRSCLIQAEDYLLEVYRYIELNPVRARMVAGPGDYPWSSYPMNALGRESDLCIPHSEYLRLSERKAYRLRKYRALFEHCVEDDLLTEIREGLNKGMALGNDRFKDEIAALTGRRLKPKQAGRPVGWRKRKESDDLSI